MPTPLLPSRDDEPVPHGNGEAEDDIVKAIDVPAFVEDYIDQYRAICQRDPDRGGGYKAVGKARDALRDAIRRAIYDAERPLLADLDTAREDAAGSRRSIDTLRDFAEGRGDGYPVAGFAVIVRDEIASLRARANTATVAADLMRARAERAEKALVVARESLEFYAIGRRNAFRCASESIDLAKGTGPCCERVIDAGGIAADAIERIDSALARKAGA